MAYGFLDIASTPGVRAAQEANGSGEYWANFHGDRAFDRFTPAEAAFIAERDSFYMATVSENGWPYVQHRGGPPGFIRILDDRTLAIPDFRGNRQYISTGNLATDDRASLILMDYPNRRRLKLYAHVEARDLAADPELATELALPGYRAKVERGLIIHLAAFDWNCPQHIIPRFSEAELEPALAPFRARLEALEEENKALRDELAAKAIAESSAASGGPAELAASERRIRMAERSPRLKSSRPHSSPLKSSGGEFERQISSPHVTRRRSISSCPANPLMKEMMMTPRLNAFAAAPAPMKSWRDFMGLSRPAWKRA